MRNPPFKVRKPPAVTRPDGHAGTGRPRRADPAQVPQPDCPCAGDHHLGGCIAESVQYEISCAPGAGIPGGPDTVALGPRSDRLVAKHRVP
jgi:hypothetical protein